MALVDLGRDASSALRASWTTAPPFHSGGVVDSACLWPMLGAGSLAASSLLAGNVFLATANPATLMTIGTGVGSAVVGPTGILAQAPFIAAGAALIPVVAPVILFVTVSSAITLRRVEKVQESLGKLYEAVEGVRRLLDAEDYARFEAAAERVDAIRDDFEQHRRFAGDTKEHLALVAADVKKLSPKYRFLVKSPIDSEDGARSAVAELARFFLAGWLDVQVDALELYLTLQNEPGFAEPREGRLRDKIQRYVKDFRQVLDADRVGAFHRRLKGELAERRRRYLPPILRRLLERELAQKVRNVRQIRRNSDSVRARMEEWMNPVESTQGEACEESLVFYREADGERALRAYHTRDLRLEPAAA